MPLLLRLAAAAAAAAATASAQFACAPSGVIPQSVRGEVEVGDKTYAVTGDGVYEYVRPGEYLVLCPTDASPLNGGWALVAGDGVGCAFVRWDDASQTMLLVVDRGTACAPDSPNAVTLAGWEFGDADAPLCRDVQTMPTALVGAGDGAAPGGPSRYVMSERSWMEVYTTRTGGGGVRDALVDLYCVHGSFKVGDGTFLSITDGEEDGSYQCLHFRAEPAGAGLVYVPAVLLKKGASCTDSMDGAVAIPGYLFGPTPSASPSGLPGAASATASASAAASAGASASASASASADGSASPTPPLPLQSAASATATAPPAASATVARTGLDGAEATPSQSSAPDGAPPPPAGVGAAAGGEVGVGVGVSLAVLALLAAGVAAVFLRRTAGGGAKMLGGGGGGKKLVAASHPGGRGAAGGEAVEVRPQAIAELLQRSSGAAVAAAARAPARL